jgi:hypothetical protein
MDRPAAEVRFIAWGVTMGTSLHRLVAVAATAPQLVSGLADAAAADGGPAPNPVSTGDAEAFPPDPLVAGRIITIRP